MLTIASPAFAPNGSLPARFTCDGDDLSPPMTWINPPVGIQSFGVLVDDPDCPDPAAPKRTWVHWIRYNLPPETRELAEGDGNRAPPDGVREALTDAGTRGYHGPCPPVGRHRYYFRLFALDCTLPDLGPKGRRQDLARAMEGHVLESAVLMGTYAHPKQ